MYVCLFVSFFFLRHVASEEFFPPTLLDKLVFIFIFFPPTKQQNPCRDPSTIEYSANALIWIWMPASLMKFFFETYVRCLLHHQLRQVIVICLSIACYLLVMCLILACQVLENHLTSSFQATATHRSTA